MNFTPQLGIAVLVALSPLYLLRFHIGEIPTTLLEIILIGFFAIVFSIQSTRREIITSFFTTHRVLKILIGFFLFSATISVYVATDMRAAFGIWKAYFVEPIIFFFIAKAFVRTETQIRDIIKMLAITAVVISLYALFQKITGIGIPTPWLAERRVTSFFPYPNAIGLFLAPLVPLFLSVTPVKLVLDILRGTGIQSSVIPAACPPKPWRRREAGIQWPLFHTKIWIPAFAGMTLTSIYFARTEAALVAIFFGLIVWGFLHNGILKKISLLLFSVGICAAFFIAPLREKIFLQDWSGVVRRITWSETVTMLTSSPQLFIFGAGLSGYPVALQPFHMHTAIEIFQYPHNIFLNFWTETGLLGLGSFLGIIIFLMHTWWKYKNNNRIAYAAGIALIIILIHGLVDVPYFKNDLALLFWLLVAVVINSGRQIDAKNINA